MTPMTLSRTLIAALTIATLAAPSALARPADMYQPAASATAPQTHPKATPSANPAPNQDLRSPDARDAAMTRERSDRSAATVSSGSAQDLRSPDARDAADDRGTFNAPDVLVVRTPHTATRQTAPSSSGIDWAGVGIGAGGVVGIALLALGGTLALARRGRGARKTAPIA